MLELVSFLLQLFLDSPLSLLEKKQPFSDKNLAGFGRILGVAENVCLACDYKVLQLGLCG